MVDIFVTADGNVILRAAPMARESGASALLLKVSPRAWPRVPVHCNTPSDAIALKDRCFIADPAAPGGFSPLHGRETVC